MPTRSRHGLTRCPECRAHVRAGARPSELVCPFCVSRKPASRGRSGALAVSLVAFSALGCGPSEPPPRSAGEETQEAPFYDEADDPVAVDVYGMPPEQNEADEGQADEEELSEDP